MPSTSAARARLPSQAFNTFIAYSYSISARVGKLGAPAAPPREKKVGQVGDIHSSVLR